MDCRLNVGRNHRAQATKSRWIQRGADFVARPLGGGVGRQGHFLIDKRVRSPSMSSPFGAAGQSRRQPRAAGIASGGSASVSMGLSCSSRLGRALTAPGGPLRRASDGARVSGGGPGRRRFVASRGHHPRSYYAGGSYFWPVRTVVIEFFRVRGPLSMRGSGRRFLPEAKGAAGKAWAKQCNCVLQDLREGGANLLGAIKRKGYGRPI